MRVLIIGCGYVGFPLARALAAMGHEVHGLRRSREPGAALREAGIHPLYCDITDPAQLQQISPCYDLVANLVSSSKGGVEEYRRVYLEGTRNLLHWLAETPPRKYVFTSSTSVYPQTDGSWVDEATPAEPPSPTAQILRQSEELLLGASRAANFPTVILRSAGIYGPGRGHLFQQFMRGEAKMTGEGTRFLNMIHLDDLVGAVIAALDRGTPGEIYNAADNCPVPEAEFFQWLGDETGRPLPPAAASAEASGRKRAPTSKRVSSAKLQQSLGVVLRYPSFREGYTPELAAVQKQKVLPREQQDFS